MILSISKKRYISKVFKQYLSPIMIEQLIKHPEKVKLGGELRGLSLFFSDIEEFTTISEKLSPKKLSGFLNEYLTAMSDIILDFGRTMGWNWASSKKIKNFIHN